MLSKTAVVEKKTRTYIPKDFTITDWESLKPHFDRLIQREPKSLADFIEFIKEVSELDAVVHEDLGWRHINKTCDTQDESLAEAYNYFLQEIFPHVVEYDDKLNRKVANSPYFKQLPEQEYQTYTRKLKRAIEIFREENIALVTKEQHIAPKQRTISGDMSIEHNGQTFTLQQASKLLEERDRDFRRDIWLKVANRRIDDQGVLQSCMDELIGIRHQIAENAGFTSYTQYRFAELGRFDYTQEDCNNFHNAVENVVKPIYMQLQEERRQILGVDKLRPWDLAVDIFGEEPLRPFQSGKELIERSINLLSHIRLDLGKIIQAMHIYGYFDVENRIGKAPGGYNYPLPESGIPFIFMNATGTQTDVTTMLHECGHAVHAFLTRDISVRGLRSTPSEVSELASMTMELIGLDYYDEFYHSEAERIRAKKEQLNRCLVVLPWIATVDAFQQWLYDHPTHSHQERNEQWAHLYTRFHGNVVDWTGYEDKLSLFWLKQGHIFDFPFYYIEYAIAQLGAIAIWRNYKESPEKGLNDYLEALRLGYRRTVPEIYETANIQFNFSEEYMKDIISFCRDEYLALSPNR